MLRNTRTWVYVCIPLILLICMMGYVTGQSNLTLQEYLKKPAKGRIKKPVYVIVKDERPAIERQKLPSQSQYEYTVDRPDCAPIAQALGSDLCRMIMGKGLVEKALIVRPDQPPPDDGIIVKVQLLSWYGRIPANKLRTEKTFAKLGLIPSYAQGQCRFSATLLDNGQEIDLGTSEGESSFSINTNATINKEGASAAASAETQAILRFLQAFEKQYIVKAEGGKHP